MAWIWSGRAKGDVDIHLTSMHVIGTYDSLLLGLPTAEFNQELIRRAVENAQTLFPSWPVYLVEPSAVIREFPAEFPATEAIGPYPELPEFRCTGEFISN